MPGKIKKIKLKPPGTGVCPECKKTMQLFRFPGSHILLVYPIHFKSKRKLCPKSHDFV
jgi:hypothetical protein